MRPAGGGAAAATTADAGRPGSLDVSSLSVRFGGLVALDDVSLDVPAGHIVGIIGPNGAGKTTLFNVVCGIVAPSSGDVTFDGRSIRRIPPHELNRFGIARTLQGLGLWRGLTVVENVMAGARRAGSPGVLAAMLGLPSSDRYEAALKDQALAELRALGIEGSADRYPATLPYGVQKWVALARALISRPALLLLDEPASGLSSNEMTELIALLRSLRERMSIALVEHRLDLVMGVCDKVHVLDFGRVIASGPPDDIKHDKAVTDAYLGEELGGGTGEARTDA